MYLGEAIDIRKGYKACYNMMMMMMMMMMEMKLPCAFFAQDPKTHVYMCGLKGMESGFAECFQE